MVDATAILTGILTSPITWAVGLWFYFVGEADIAHARENGPAVTWRTHALSALYACILAPFIALGIAAVMSMPWE